MHPMQGGGGSIKRIVDVAAALLVLALAMPLLAVAGLAIWLGDGGGPIYRAPRVGRGGRDFTMLKLRTMVAGADRLGGRLTPDSDPRVTRVGAWLRRCKIDEFPQLWNVLRGEMSIVGPRPDLRQGGVDGYAPGEMALLSVRPGITDFASILFFDEGRLLDGARDPIEFYMAAVRPLKSRLGLLYVARRSLRVDLAIMGLTALSLVARPAALRGVARMLHARGADADLVAIRGIDGQHGREAAMRGRDEGPLLARPTAG
ncbi:MAG: sugar transferase [Sphingomonas sp.]